MLIASVSGALPPHRHTQEEITAAFGRLVAPDGELRDRVVKFHQAVRVETRSLALPLEAYPRLAGFGAANQAFIEVGTDLAAQAVGAALERAGLAPRDVDLVMFTTVTGVAAPSIDARLVPRLGLREDVKRLPLFGLGCVAGAAGVARLADYLRAWPDHVAVLVAVELCSLTLQRGDLSAANLIASGLFGDGAAAVVGVGEARGRAMGLGGEARGAAVVPRVVAYRSRLYPNTERVMGWDVTGDGFKLVLAQSVPEVVREHLGGDVRRFLADHGLAPRDVAAWVCHPGGPKVLEAVQEALDLPPSALELTWRSLAEVGNLSSASVLQVLEATLAARRLPPGAPGLLLAMGPGFCSELVLLRG